MRASRKTRVLRAACLAHNRCASDDRSAATETTMNDDALHVKFDGTIDLE
jgi:hypothetical protein